MMAIGEGFCYGVEAEGILRTMQRIRERISKLFEGFWKEEEELFKTRVENGMSRDEALLAQCRGLKKSRFLEFIATEPVFQKPFGLRSENESEETSVSLTRDAFALVSGERKSSNGRSGSATSMQSPSTSSSTSQRTISLLPFERV